MSGLWSDKSKQRDRDHKRRQRARAAAARRTGLARKHKSVRTARWLRDHW